MGLYDETPGLLEGASAWFQQPGMGYYPGSTVAGFNPMQQDAWGAGLGAAGDISDMTGQMGQGYWDMMMGGGPMATAGRSTAGTAMDMFNNPHIAQTIQNNANLMNQNYSRNIAPGMEAGTVAAGGMGSSRSGIAQGMAVGDLNQQIGDMSSQMNLDMYNRGMEGFLTQREQDLQSSMANAGYQTQASLANAANQYGALGMMPDMMSAMSQGMLSPYNMMTGIGAQQQGLTQQQIGGEMDRWGYYRDQPFDQLSKYASLIGSTQGQQMPGYDPPPGMDWGQGFSGLMKGWGSMYPDSGESPAIPSPGGYDPYYGASPYV